MAYMTNREFAEHEYNRQKQNAYADALVKEVRQLREEKQEREKGCEYCGEERHRIREAFDDGTAKIINAVNRYALSVDTSRDAFIFNIFYCPMCGKSLKEAANER